MAELKHAIETNNIEEVKRLIENGANIHTNQDDALLKASGYGHTEIVKMLLQAGADINVAGEALTWASEYGRTEVVRVLLEGGADVHTRKDESLFKASERGHTEIVKMLLQAGANANARKGKPLIYACIFGHNEIVRLLLEAGADIHVNGDEPLISASMNKRLETVRILLEAGANVHAGGDASLVEASARGHNEIVRLLLEAGANEYDRALHAAIEYRRPDTIKLLLENGADPNGWNNKLLVSAFSSKRKEILMPLLEAGAKITSKNVKDIEDIQKIYQYEEIAVLLENFKRKVAKNQEKKEKKEEEKKESNPIVEKLCFTHNTIGGDPLKDTDDFVVFLIQTEGEEEQGECYLKSELEKVVENAPDVSIWEGPPSGTAYKGPRYISGEKLVPYPGKKKEGINNKVYRLPWTGVWVTNAVIQRALFSGDLIIVLGGENMSIGSVFGSGQMHGQYGGHWGYLDGNPDEAVYFEDGDFQPDERIPVYDVVDSYR